MEGVILYIKIVHVFGQEDKKHYIIFTLLSYGESFHHCSIGCMFIGYTNVWCIIPKVYHWCTCSYPFLWDSSEEVICGVMVKMSQTCTVIPQILLITACELIAVNGWIHSKQFCNLLEA